MEKRYLTAKETADYCSVSIYTVYRWKESGLLPWIEIGEGERPGIRFDIQDINLFMGSKRMPAIWEQTISL